MKTTYALVTVTLRVGIKHTNKSDPTEIFNTLEVRRATVEGGKVFCVDVVDGVDEVDIVD